MAALETTSNKTYADTRSVLEGMLFDGMSIIGGVKHVRVVMNHVTRDGGPKLLRRCSLPLTGTGVIVRVFTELCVLDITMPGFELAEGGAVEDVVANSEADIVTDAVV